MTKYLTGEVKGFLGFPRQKIRGKKTMETKDIFHDKNISGEMTMGTKDIFGTNFWRRKVFLRLTFDGLEAQISGRDQF